MDATDRTTCETITRYVWADAETNAPIECGKPAVGVSGYWKTAVCAHHAKARG